ncbi:hypothetical protein YC2023_082232 [Brassica napus]
MMSQIVTAYINRCMDEIVTLKRVRGISPLLHGNEKLSWAGQCNLSDVSLLAEDTARTGWLEWMGSLQFESRDRMEFCVDKAPRPRLALLLIALDKLSTAIAALHDRWYGPPITRYVDNDELN